LPKAAKFYSDYFWEKQLLCCLRFHNNFPKELDPKQSSRKQGNTAHHAYLLRILDKT
jgi:hypothetical protein